MQIVSGKAELRKALSIWQASGERIAIVPTMGSLHDGHLSLVHAARQHADRVVVTVFVNPTQFGPCEDYETYPRSLQSDAAKLVDAGADLLFAPGDAEVYPFGPENATRVIVPAMTDRLCGATRPGHFDGVTSVVARLFALVQPDVAVFGQKDFQQQLIIHRMVDDLGLPIDIRVAPIVREADGLAMSSRNAYLSADDRVAATAIYRVLSAAAEDLRSGSRDFAAIEANASRRLEDSVRGVEYFAIRQAEDLLPANAGSRHLVLLAAAWVGDVRLIDNVLVDLE